MGKDEPKTASFRLRIRGNAKKHFLYIKFLNFIVQARLLTHINALLLLCKKSLGISLHPKNKSIYAGVRSNSVR